MRPLSIVEDPWLLEFIRFITQELGGILLDVPGVTQLRDDIKRIAAELRASLKARIHEGCWYYCITTDIWTSRKAQSYMALTLHYRDEDFTMCSWTLEVESFPGMHTGVVIASGLEQMLERWELNPEMCTLLVRDGAANAVLASNILGVNNTSCIAHSLHLVLGGALLGRKPRVRATGEFSDPPTTEVDLQQDSVQDEVVAASAEEQDAVLTELESVLDTLLINNAAAQDALAQVRVVVQRFRSLATYFHMSAKATNRLDIIQTKDWNRPALHLITDCPTRWNSCRIMLVRLVELEAPLDTFYAYLEKPEGKEEFKDLSQDKFPVPKGWFVIKCLIALLYPIVAVTKVLEGCHYPTLALAFPMLRRIKKVLSSPNIFDKQARLVGRHEFLTDTLVTMYQMRKAMLSLFADRFKGVKLELVRITFLDPRFHKMKLLQEDEVEVVKNALVDAAALIASNVADLPQKQAQISRSDTRRRSTSDEMTGVWDDVQGSGDDDEGSLGNDPLMQNLRVTCAQEFVSYLEAAKKVHRKQDPLTWWSDNGHNYPSLNLLARKWLGCVATSVPSEQAFSTAGNTVTAKRCQLEPALVRDVVFMAENAICKTK
jgi:hypothetical protein